MKTWIIDDEIIAIQVMEKLLEPYRNIKIEGKYSDPVKALSDMVHNEVDLLFLDIEMGTKNGLELAERFMQVHPKLTIIFVTAHSEYALDAFELNVADYLLKPVQPSRLEKTMKRISETLSKRLDHDIKYKIQSFGSFSLLDEDNKPISWRTQKTKELLAFLWSQNGDYIERDILIDTLFPDREYTKANTLFSTTLYQLRKILDATGVDWEMNTINTKYKLDIDIMSDYDQCIKLINQTDFNEEVFDTLVKSYPARFMEYDGYLWSYKKSEGINNLVLTKVKEYLKNILPTQNLDLIDKVYMFVYKLDPLDDVIVTEIIQLYRSLGQFTKLESFYKRHTTFLQEELEVTPSTLLEKVYKEPK